MKIYSVYMSGNTSEPAVETFSNEETRRKYVETDISEVLALLRDDGYCPTVLSNAYVKTVYADGIEYVWELFESELK